jgi:hypothetical protein
MIKFVEGFVVLHNILRIYGLHVKHVFRVCACVRACVPACVRQRARELRIIALSSYAF